MDENDRKRKKNIIFAKDKSSTQMERNLKVIISGGGTGGHIFPAISIANAIKAKQPGAEILFVGALGRMEMQRVPAAGYEIKGLPICGFDRKNLLKNVSVLFKIWKSQRLAKKNHKGIPAPGGCRCRRLRKRSDAQQGGGNGHSLYNTRAEQLRWCNQ
jgi:hypothetical protein